MISSKVLNLGKTDLISRFSEQSWGKGQTHHNEHFNIGYPIGNPPRLRGSLFVLLSSKFILENKDFIVYGSPVDIGGLEFGFFKTKVESQKIIEGCKCDGEKFLALILKMSKMTTHEAVIGLYQHKMTIELLNILKSFFSSVVIDFIEEHQSNPHALLFEFCLSARYLLNEEHIYQLHIPNTLDPQITFPYLHTTATNKIVSYNPKYGINNVKVE